MVAIPFWAYILIFAVVAYLIGSIPTGYLIKSVGQKVVLYRYGFRCN